MVENMIGLIAEAKKDVKNAYKLSERVQEFRAFSISFRYEMFYEVSGNLFS